MAPSSARTLVVAVTAALLLLGALSAPAAAHGRGSESTNYDSRILTTPELDGVTWEVYGGDQYLVVTNTSDTELVVTGYRDEPYLRVGPDGVFENMASEATYVNNDRYGEVGELPPDIGPEQEPRWSKVSDTPKHAWHDHRIHWMSTQDPPMLTDKSRETVINPWKVDFAYGEQTQSISGELAWVPAPSPLPWLALAAVLTAPALLGLRHRGSADWIRPLVRPAAAVLFVVSLLNLTHLLDDFLAVPAPFSSQIIAGAQTALFIALGLFGAIVSWRGRDGAFTALGVGSGGILIGQGLIYLDALTRNTSVSIFPSWPARLIVALSIAQALFVGAVAVIGNRRLAAAEDETVPGEVVAT
jgi:hypothetical protein